MQRNAIWLSAIAVSAAFAIVGAESDGLRVLHYLFKPLTTLLVAAMVWRTAANEHGYRRAVLAGLLLSLLGDVFLMLPGDWFAFGLGSFLLAHLCYLRAFRLRGEWLRPIWPVLAYGVIAATVLAYLWPHLPVELKIPVVVYVVALAGMAAQAACIWRQRPDGAALLATAGGACFVLSDALLAIDRFAMAIPLASVWVLLGYWAAQWLIGASVMPVTDTSRN